MQSQGARGRGPQAKIWVVEDEAEIACLFSDVLIDFEKYMLVCVDNAAKVFARPGDIIFLDLRGTNASALNSNGAKVITMSGSPELAPDVAKPFRFQQIRTQILKTLAEHSALYRKPA